MAWLKAISSSIYVYIALAFTALIGYAKLERYRRKKSDRRADNAEANEKLLVKTIKVERDIDEQKADDESQAKLTELRNIKDLGDITNEVENLTSDEFIDRIAGLLKNPNKDEASKDS